LDCGIEDADTIKKAKNLDKELDALCTNFGTYEMGYVTDNLEEAKAIHAKALKV